jgi:hypothetical protein
MTTLTAMWHVVTEYDPDGLVLAQYELCPFCWQSWAAAGLNLQSEVHRVVMRETTPESVKRCWDCGIDALGELGRWCGICGVELHDGAALDEIICRYCQHSGPIMYYNKEHE